MFFLLGIEHFLRGELVVIVFAKLFKSKAFQTRPLMIESQTRENERSDNFFGLVVF